MKVLEFTPAEIERLLANHRAGQLANHRADQVDDVRHDPFPVLKIVLPPTASVWLITEMEERDHDVLFGLCDLGMGFPELGYVLRSEIAGMATYSSPGSAGTVRFAPLVDRAFKASKPLSAYTAAADAAGRIVT